MRRTSLNFLVDVVAFLFMLGMIATGLIVRFALPPGTGGRWTIWGMGRHDWGDLHYYLAIGLLVLLLLHLALHWAWTCVIADKMLASIGLSIPAHGVSQKHRSIRRWGVGLATLAIMAGVIGGFYEMAASNVVTNAHGTIRRGGPRWAGSGDASAPQVDDVVPIREDRARGGGGGRGGADVRGSMTLAEVAEGAGVSTAQLTAALGLPADLSGDARIGRLRREHGLTMSQIRDVVATLSEPSSDP